MQQLKSAYVCTSFLTSETGNSCKEQFKSRTAVQKYTSSLIQISNLQFLLLDYCSEILSCSFFLSRNDFESPFLVFSSGGFLRVYDHLGFLRGIGSFNVDHKVTRLGRSNEGIGTGAIEFQ